MGGSSSFGLRRETDFRGLRGSEMAATASNDVDVVGAGPSGTWWLWWGMTKGRKANGCSLLNKIRKSY